jgi:hypothetical protein
MRIWRRQDTPVRNRGSPTPPDLSRMALSRCSPTAWPFASDLRTAPSTSACKSADVADGRQLGCGVACPSVRRMAAFDHTRGRILSSGSGDMKNAEEKRVALVDRAGRRICLDDLIHPRFETRETKQLFQRRSRRFFVSHRVVVLKTEPLGVHRNFCPV